MTRGQWCANAGLLLAFSCSEQVPSQPDAAVASDAAAPHDASSNTDASTSPDGGQAIPRVDCSAYQDLSDCSLRVTPSASSDADGLSWQSPLDLQSALDRCTCSCEVWVAGGTYLPTRSFREDDPRTVAFQLSPGCTVYGGFAGDESARDERDPQAHPSVLSGDLGEPGVVDDNAYHVMFGAEGATLDGLQLRHGQADGTQTGDAYGGGLYNASASVVLRNVTISDNYAVTGAGMFNDTSSHPRIYDSVFARNRSDVAGGIHLGGSASARVERCSFDENVAIFIGGGISVSAGHLSVVDSRFTRNRSDFGGAFAVSGGTAQVERGWFEANQSGLFGGAVMVRESGDVTVSSSVFVSNSSVGHGGTFAVWTAQLQLLGVTVVGGSAAFGGAMWIKDGAQVDVSDSLLWANVDDDDVLFLLEGDGNVFQVRGSIVPAQAPGADNLHQDPDLSNLPLLTRFTEAAGSEAQLRLANPLRDFAVGDRVEIGDDGVLRTVTALDELTVSFSPALSEPAPRFLRVDLWDVNSVNLDLDPTPGPGSPAIDRASDAAPEFDVYGNARVDIAGVGNECADGGCPVADVGGIEVQP